MFNGVKPVSGFRLDCYRHALLPALNYFNKDIRPFLLSKIGRYTYNNSLDFVEVELMRYKLAFKYLGINDEYFYLTNKTIKENICSLIDNGKFVIVYLDTYYYSHFPSSYKNFHSRHGVLVYGYDLKKDIFYTIDTDFVESFEGKNIIIPMEDVIFAHEKMIEHYNMKDFVETIENYDDKKGSFFEDYICYYSNYYLNNWEKFSDSINDLYLFVSEFGNVLSCEEAAMKYASQLYIAFNRAINCRHLMYSTYSYIFDGIGHILECLDCLIDELNYVRAVMYKSIYSREYRRVSFEKCFELMKKIVSREEELNCDLSKFLSQFKS